MSEWLTICTQHMCIWLRSGDIPVFFACYWTMMQPINTQIPQSTDCACPPPPLVIFSQVTFTFQCAAGIFFLACPPTSSPFGRWDLLLAGGLGGNIPGIISLPFKCFTMWRCGILDLAGLCRQGEQSRHSEHDRPCWIGTPEPFGGGRREVWIGCKYCNWVQRSLWPCSFYFFFIFLSFLFFI